MKKMMLVAALAACRILGAADSPALEVEKSFAEASFWDSDPMLLMSELGKSGFAFTSGEKTAADCRRAGAVTCFGFEVFETNIRFGEEKGVDAVEISLYNNGGVEKVEVRKLDDGTKISHHSRSERKITRDEFMRICKEAGEKLTPKGEKPPKATNGAMRTAEMTVKEKVWKKSAFGGYAKLSWSYEQKGKDSGSFKPGYIKLVVSAPSAENAKEPSARKGGSAKGAGKITDNILKDSRGTFLDNVPMVDQGMKGYCAAATSERVLKYYGVDVDEHEIAQLAGTSADAGTSTKAMKDSVEKVGKKHQLGTVVCYGDFDDGVEQRIAGLNKEVDNYNKAAKKLKCKPITPDMYIHSQGNMTSYDIAAVDAAMEPKVLVEMKTRLPGFKRFKKDVRDQINKGIPLFWGVKLGVAAEPEIPQTMGYHIRLIIGYNDKKGEIIYTDSWGAGHEFKKMREDWAWTITKSLFYMKPRMK